MNYCEAMEYMEQCSGYGMVPGLENIRELLNRLGQPQKDMKFIHISGTNGKGSTLAFISTILTENGYKTGRYLSPVVFEYREKFQVQGKAVSKAMIARLMEQVKEASEKMYGTGWPHPTPFEIETALAFLIFKEKKCDFVVLETGMGGTLDATNIIDHSLICVITSISMDHMAYLGNSLKEIAAHKAGIMKEGSFVITSNSDPDILSVLEKEGEKKGIRSLIRMDKKEIKKVKYGLSGQSFSYKGYEKMEISLLGTYQIENAALALEVAEGLKKLGYRLREDKIRKAMKETKWSGRFQVICRNPFFVVDGAHNYDSVCELKKSVEFYFTNKKIIYIIGMFRDKDYRSVVEESCKMAAHVITVSTKGNKRSLSNLELAGVVSEVNPMVTTADSVEEAVELGFLLADKNTVVIAFGSLSYLGECIHAVNHRKEMRKDTHGK